MRLSSLSIALPRSIALSHIDRFLISTFCFAFRLIKIMASTTSALLFFLVVAFSGYMGSNLSALAARPTSFDFPSFNLQNFTLLGDSYLRDGIVGLTSAVEVSTSSAGAVVYNEPISLFDPLSNSLSSFSTRFTFFISSVDPGSFGDGLAFFLSPTNLTLGLPGRSLGLVNPSKFVAIEFDTHQDLDMNDPSENHVGLDIDSTASFKTGDPILEGIDLKSGNLITAWIEYKSFSSNLQVFLSYSNVKPPNPILGVDSIDLSDHLKGELYVGFSASTEGSTELHLIKDWSFETFEFHPSRPRSHSHNLSDSSVTTIAEGVLKTDTARKHQRRLELGFAIAGTAVFCALLSVMGYITLRKRKDTAKQRTFKTELVGLPKEFSYRELKSATRGFHSSRIIGRGSFGTVYKALFISSGTIAAVKRSRQRHEGETEFQAELSIIAGLRHKNLVQLQGWCVEKGELLLVYDFMAHGSLEDVLYDESKKCNLLSWSHRRDIAIGVASVLTYLHQECEQRVIHRDVKTANILLDGNFNPRLGDFGLAKLMDHDKSPVSTLTAGTMGYLAPEYLQYGKATDKTDVFSYGVVVLEVACGRRPIQKEGHRMVNLVDWVWTFHSKGKLLEAADKRLMGEFEEEGMRKLLLLGLSCSNPDNAQRPSMRRVLQILNDEAELPLVPKTKPCLTFSHELPLTIDEIVSDAEDSTETATALTSSTETEETSGLETKINIY